VHDRVLHERLQCERRHQCRLRGRLDLPAHRQPVGKPHEFNVEIITHRLEFASEYDLLLLGHAEGCTQQVGQAHYHARVAVLITRYERDHGVERVEQEMRIEL